MSPSNLAIRDHRWHWPQVLCAGHCDCAGWSAGPRGWAEGTHLPGGLLGVRQAGHTRTPATLGQTGAFEGLILSPSLAVGAERSLQHHKTQNILQEFLPVALR